MASADFQYIDSDSQLQIFCEESAGAKLVGFDTEFVSESRYRPDLCLLQVAVDDVYVIIDTMAINDLMPFWDFLVDGDHITIAHAAREEFLFCYRACGAYPKRLFDVQLAAGMVGDDFPISYGNLVSRSLSKTIDKGETRTDWRRRPLSDRQIKYALSDVIHLKRLYQKLSKKLDKLNRTEWFEDEMKTWQIHLCKSHDEPQWRRVSGISSLKPPALAIVRELWIARDRVAAEKNRSPKRILPDDLIVELAKRGSSDLKRLKAIRGFENRVNRSMQDPIAAAIEKANALPQDQWPKRLPRGKSTNLGLLGQFLSTALNVVCRDQSIAPSLVGTANDVRTMAAWKLGMIDPKDKPALASGWRAEMIGHLIERVLDGTIAIRVDNPASSDPLKLEYLDRD